jgi:2-oxoglutarate ferredoxin oxidoreductase subunit alpha
VLLLSDGYLANGAEPWRVPDVDTLPDLRSAVGFASANGAEFQPFARDEQTLARPWAIPGTAGLEHRIGGLEKAEGSGNISYDPDNHHRMTEIRQAKIDGIAASIPALEVDDDGAGAAARVLILGWGSTFGPIHAAVRRVRARGLHVARAHLRHLNPFPPNTGEVLRRYDRVLVPEMNMGQLQLLLRARYLVDVRGIHQVTGLPFTSQSLEERIVAAMDELAETM